MAQLKTSEAVLFGHPDKVADQISDAVLDKMLSIDPKARVAVETLVTGNNVIVAGELGTAAANFSINLDEVVRQAVAGAGYTSSILGFDAFSCRILNLLHQQSANLSQLQALGPTVAGDQGIMFGYATVESPDNLPLQFSVARQALFEIHKLGLPDLHTDAKALCSVQFPDDDLPILKSLEISIHTSRTDFQEVAKHVIRRLRELYLGYLKIPALTTVKFNPAGPFIFGGPAADTGLTGRKIVVDQYGGEVPVGGGAFSGKDPSKVDRSAAYYARYVALNLVRANICSKALVSVSYMIGQDGPSSVTLNTFGTNHTSFSDADVLAKCLKANIFDFRVEKIIEKLQLRNPIYEATAHYGHFGVEPFANLVQVGDTYKAVTFFPWEKPDLVTDITTALS